MGTRLAGGSPRVGDYGLCFRGISVLAPRVRSLTEKVLREAASRTSKAWNPRGWSDADKEKVLLVDPHSIAHYRTIAGWEHPHLAGYDEAGGITARKFVRLNSGKVLDGDWDQNLPSFDNKIGRASCRERAETWGGAGV